MYGYKRELLVKYGAQPGKALYRLFMQLGASLPLAGMVGDKTLVLHGGLFRGPPVKVKGGKKGSKKKTFGAAPLVVGTLVGIRVWGGKGGEGRGATRVCDVYEMRDFRSIPSHCGHAGKMSPFPDDVVTCKLWMRRILVRVNVRLCQCANV